MVTIRVSCDDCEKDFDITERDITVVIDRTERLNGVYRFLCRQPENAESGHVVIKEAPSNIVRLLIGAGCEQREYSSGVSVIDLQQHREMDEMWGAITDDELIDLAVASEAAVSTAFREELLA